MPKSRVEIFNILGWSRVCLPTSSDSSATLSLEEEMASEAPPSYNDAVKGRDAPPSYDQVFGVSEIKQAKEDSSNKGVFAVKLCEIICGSVACMICVLVLAALPVAMIVIGSLYLDDCPDRDKIPIWLIVFGCVSLVQTLINIVKRCFKLLTKDKDSERERERRERDPNYGGRGGNCMEGFLSFFLFIWIIIGSVWVFGYWNAYRFSNNSCGVDIDFCCHPVPYLFSFITLIVIYACSFLVCCCCCCCFCILALAAGASGAGDSDD